MKKLLSFCLSLVIILSVSPAYTESELEITTGRLLYTDISTYINHYPIESYATDTGYMVVKLRDLEHFGFNIGWNEEMRIVTIEDVDPIDGQQIQITGIEDVKLPAERAGIMYKKYCFGDVKALFAGKEIPVYLAEGSSYIMLEQLNEIGEVYWIPEICTMKAWINKFSMCEYAPIEKKIAPEKPIITDSRKYASFDNTKNGWWFRKNSGSSEIDQSVASCISNNRVIFRDYSRPRKIYLTFDEGYEEGYTNMIIDTLNKYNVPATFFITGDFLKDESDLVARMLEYGYTIGNHTMKHPDLTSISIQKAAYEISELNNRFRDMFGMNMHYMRPPEGSYSKRLLQLADDMDYITVFWSFAYNDWDTANQKGADYAFNQISPYLHDGAVLLLHPCSSDNAYVLDRLIQHIISEGYAFGSLDEIWVGK